MTELQKMASLMFNHTIPSLRLVEQADMERSMESSFIAGRGLSLDSIQVLPGYATPAIT